MGTYKVRNEIETKRNETKRNHGTTEKQHIPDLVQAFSQEDGGF